MNSHASFQAVQRLIAHLRTKRSAGTAPTPLPEDLLRRVRQVEPGGGLAGRFATAARRNGITVEEASNESLADRLIETLRAKQAVRVFVEGGAAESDAVRRRLAAAGFATHHEPTAETLFSVDASVTWVDAAIAETGSLVVRSGKHSARGASLIPPIHVAVVHESQIVADLVDHFADQPPGPASASEVLISGASKTADIEGVLVTGVHGPGQVIVLLVRSDGSPPAARQ